MINNYKLRGRRALALLAVSAPMVLTGMSGISSASSAAQTVNAQLQQSQNWAGYVVQGKAGQDFSAVSGSWKEPSVSAASGQGDSAFWVGLGGASKQSQALEQIGTSADVVNGQAQYSAWYELVPAPETKLGLPIHPGDHMSARVTVDGLNVTMSLADQTTGQSVTKTVKTSNPDTSSAEWIAEAPSTETPGGGTQILPLANFGKVTFTNAYATAGGHQGSISDPNWTAKQTQLSSSGGSGVLGGGTLAPGLTGGSQSSAGASPSSLSSGGTSFSVSYSGGGGSPASTGGSGSPGYPGGGYVYPGSGYVYPGGGYLGGGYGYPGLAGGYAYVLPGGYVVVI
jgi:hypothetical protein